jgi:hypothetical protein
MEWQFIVALVVAIPVVLLAVAFVWYLNVSGLYQVIRDAYRKRARAAEMRKRLALVEKETTKLGG